MGCYVWYSDEGTGWGPSLPRPLIAVPNVTAHPSMASVPITVLLYNGPLLCGFNVPINPLKGTLKLLSIGSIYRSTVIGTLAIDGWAVTFGTAKRGLGRLGPAQSHPSTASVPTSYYLMWHYNCLCTLKVNTCTSCC